MLLFLQPWRVRTLPEPLGQTVINVQHGQQTHLVAMQSKHIHSAPNGPLNIDQLTSTRLWNLAIVVRQSNLLQSMSSSGWRFSKFTTCSVFHRDFVWPSFIFGCIEYLVHRARGLRYKSCDWVRVNVYRAALSRVVPRTHLILCSRCEPLLSQRRSLRLSFQRPPNRSGTS